MRGERVPDDATDSDSNDDTGSRQRSTGGQSRFGRRRLLERAGTAAVAVPFAGYATRQDAEIDIEFVDLGTVAVTGDTEAINGVSFQILNTDVVSDLYTPGRTIVGRKANSPIFTKKWPHLGYYRYSDGVVFVDTSVWLDFVYSIDVFTTSEPKMFGDSDFYATNPHDDTSARVRIQNVSVEDGTFASGDAVGARVTVANTEDRSRTCFLGMSALDADGRHRGTTDGRTVDLGPGETKTVLIAWSVGDDAPAGEYTAHVGVWRNADPGILRFKYDQTYVSSAFDVEGGGGGDDGGGNGGGDDGGRDDDGGDGGTGQRTLSVTKRGAARGGVAFAVTASGDVSPGGDFEGAVEGSSALDYMGPKRGTDSVRYTGEITDFTLKGDATVLVDGTPVSPEALGGPHHASGGGGLPNTLTVTKGEQPDNRVPFAVTVSGEIGRGKGSDAVISGSTAVDWVGPKRGTDTLRYSGRITRLLYFNDAEFYRNGTRVDPDRF